MPPTGEAKKPAVQALDALRQKGAAREDTSKQFCVGSSVSDRISGRGPSESSLGVKSCSHRRVRHDAEQKHKSANPNTVPSAYTVLAPSVSQRDEIRRKIQVCVIRSMQMPTCLTWKLRLEHLQGDAAALERLQAWKVAVTYTVPKGQKSVCLFPSSSVCYIPSEGGTLLQMYVHKEGFKKRSIINSLPFQ